MLKMNHEICPCCMRVTHNNRHLSHENSILCHHSDEWDLKRKKENKKLDIISLLENVDISVKSYNKLLNYLDYGERCLIVNQVSRHDVLLSTRNTEMVAPALNEEFSSLLKKPTTELNWYTDPLAFPTNSVSFYQNHFAIDVSNLAKVFETVEQCSWYWGDLNNVEASKLLRDCPLGCFILRNSSDKRYLFSLTTVTKIGISSIRIVYSGGSFHFETDTEERKRKSSDSSANSQRKNDEKCVINMVLLFTEFLQENVSNRLNKSGAPYSDNEETKKNTARKTKSDSEKFVCSLRNAGVLQKFQVHLKYPKRRNFPSLKELSRFVINQKYSLWKNSTQINCLCLPFELKQYLNMYPYPV